MDLDSVDHKRFIAAFLIRGAIDTSSCSEVGLFIRGNLVVSGSASGCRSYANFFPQLGSGSPDRIN